MKANFVACGIEFTAEELASLRERFPGQLVIIGAENDSWLRSLSGSEVSELRNASAREGRRRGWAEKPD